MAGVAGRSGAKMEKPWRTTLNKILREPCEDDPSKRRLMRVAEACVKAAESGDMQAIMEIGNRLDGRSVQPIAGADGVGPLVLEIVRFAALDHQNNQSQVVDVTPKEVSDNPKPGISTTAS